MHTKGLVLVVTRTTVMCCSFVEVKEGEGMEEVGAGDYSLSSKV